MNDLAATSAAVAVALGLSGSAVALPHPPSVQCEIEVVTTPHGTVLRPVARSAAALSGEYRLSVESAGSGGSSQVSQGGAFSLTPGRPETLGSVSLAQSSGMQVLARMELSWAGGRTHCERRVRA